MFNSMMPMAEKIRILRARPEMLRKFVADAEKARADEVKYKHKCLLDQRIQKRKALNCAYLPLIADFEAHNRLHVGVLNVKMDPVALTQKSQLLQAQVGDVQSRKRRLVEGEEFATQ